MAHASRGGGTPGTSGTSSASHLCVNSKASILPYGDTLHYPGCGCPASWTAGSRMCDLVDLVFHHCHTLFQRKMLPPVRPLRVVYMLPHHNITGGMKCLVEHIKLLRQRGHTTIAVHRSDTATSAMPPWTDVEPNVDLVCTLQQRLNDVYPVEQIDVVVVGIFHQVAELLMGVPAPVIYWEQGHEWVFGDPVRFQPVQNYIKQDQLFHMVMHLPVPMAVVSKAVQDILQQDFGRASVVVPNGIDCNRFFPGERLLLPSVDRGADPGDVQAAMAVKSVLLVGNPALPLKGFDVAITVLSAVNKLIPISVRWICQVKPTVAMVPALDTCDLRITYCVSPPQSEIPKLYRGHDLFLFTSRYEAWGMPVMEAMASGVPVVTTDCLGVRTFGKHGSNCLMANTLDVNALFHHVLRLLTDDNARALLSKAGRETALMYGPQNVVETLEAVLYSLTACAQELLKARQASTEELQMACSWAAEACLRPSQASRG